MAGCARTLPYKGNTRKRTRADARGFSTNIGIASSETRPSVLERPLQLIQPGFRLVRPLADEFRRDMQLFYRNPVQLGQGTELVEQSRKYGPDVGRNVDGSEKSQDPLVYGNRR